MNQATRTIFASNLTQWLILLICLAAVLFPRFDRRDLGVDGMVGADAPSDATQYVSMVSVYRGAEPLQQPEAPFTYRPLVPWLAASLPLAEMTSINVVNVTGLAITVVLLGQILAALGCTARGIFVGRLLFIISFPVFYYGAIGIVDPPVLACLAGGVYLALKRQYWLSILPLLLGACIKETVILIIPFVVLLMLTEGTNKKRVMIYALGACIAYATMSYLLRQISIDPSQEGWSPSLETLRENATRVRTWLSFALSFGLPGLLAVVALLMSGRNAIGQRLPAAAMYGGMLCSIALFGLSLIAAYADGRFIWPAVIFTIPVAIVWLESRFPALFGET